MSYKRNREEFVVQNDEPVATAVTLIRFHAQDPMEVSLKLYEWSKIEEREGRMPALKIEEVRKVGSNKMHQMQLGVDDCHSIKLLGHYTIDVVARAFAYVSNGSFGKLLSWGMHYDTGSSVW